MYHVQSMYPYTTDLANSSVLLKFKVKKGGAEKHKAMYVGSSQIIKDSAFQVFRVEFVQ